MRRFFEIGRGLARPTMQSLRRAEKPASAAFAPKLPATIVTTPAAPAITQESPVIMESVLPTPSAPTRFFPAIALGAGGPVDSATIEQYILATENRELQGLAARCANALNRLLDQGARASFLSRAIEETQGTDCTPEQWLADTLKAIEIEIGATKQDHARQEVRRKARFNRLWPLREAVSTRLTNAEVESLRLAERIRLAEQNPFGSSSPNPYQKLIDAGLTPEQIKVIGVGNPVSRIEKETAAAKARLEMLLAELPALRAFSNDPRHSPEHLAGLPGFDALIAQSQNITEE